MTKREKINKCKVCGTTGRFSKYCRKCKDATPYKANVPRERDIATGHKGPGRGDEPFNREEIAKRPISVSVKKGEMKK